MTCRLMPNRKPVVVMNAFLLWIVGASKDRPAGKRQGFAGDLLPCGEVGYHIVFLGIRHLANVVGASNDDRSKSLWGPLRKIDEIGCVIHQIPVSSQCALRRGLRA